MVQIAANFTSEEKNAEFRLHYMLHVDRKSARKWRDLPLPFPETRKEPVREDLGGVRQLQAVAPHIQVTHLPVKHKPSAVAEKIKSTLKEKQNYG